jgi:LacI family transcriptional regulator
VGKKPKELGLFLYVSNEISSSIFYGEFITYIIDYAENLGYSVLTSLIKSDQYGKMTQFLNTDSIQGAIVIGGNQNEKEVLELMESRHKIFVVDQIHQDAELKQFCGIVNPDNYKGAYIATEHLIKNGHKEIMMISGHMGRMAGIERLRGYKQALIDNNIKINNKVILIGDFGDSTAESILKKYLKKNTMPTAIFAATDMSAIGAMHVLKENGYKVPNDVSIVGFDDIYLAKEVEPKLTTINSHHKTMAKVAVEKLINMIETEEFRESKTLIDVTLVERNSVRNINIK